MASMFGLSAPAELLFSLSPNPGITVSVSFTGVVVAAVVAAEAVAVEAAESDAAAGGVFAGDIIK